LKVDFFNTLVEIPLENSIKIDIKYSSNLTSNDKTLKSVIIIYNGLKLIKI